MTPFIARHGDLLVRSIGSIPAGLSAQENTVLAYGEATNHAHRLVEGQVTVFTGTGKEAEKKYFKVAQGGAKLVHQEHKTIDIPQGQYEVLNEREYSPFDDAIRAVQD